MKNIKASLILVIYLLQTVNSISYFVSDDKEDYNSDEDRFYIDDSNWPSLNERNDNPSSRSLDENSAFENVTVKVGRQATLPCFIDNLGSFKVIWAKSGDILALGTSKINSDPRLIIQHRYVSEWHLIIDNVATEDEGEYICKTNGNFYKTINLQVLMPPTIDDTNSIPAGTINLKEDSSLTLKCLANGKPNPSVKWYRWKNYKSFESNKEEVNSLNDTEVAIKSIKRDDPNTYECIAKNGVAPATSRIFNIEIHFLPSVVLQVRAIGKFKKFSLECRINANPLERVLWYRNGEQLFSEFQFEREVNQHNMRLVSQDVSSIKEFYKTLVKIDVMNAQRSDFGEYQCCAMNAYGQVCSSVKVKQPESEDRTTNEPITTSTRRLTTTKLIHTLFWNNEQDAGQDEVFYKNSPVFEKPTKPVAIKFNSSEADTRRHYLLKNFLHLNSSSYQVKSNNCALSIVLLFVVPVIRFGSF